MGKRATNFLMWYPAYLTELFVGCEPLGLFFQFHRIFDLDWNHDHTYSGAFTAHNITLRNNILQNHLAKTRQTSQN